MDSGVNTKESPTQKAEAKQNFNIELIDFGEAYIRLKRAFAERKIVITGGRAVNLHTNADTRRSSDVDVIVDMYAGELEGFAKLAQYEGFSVDDTYNREKGAPGIRLVDNKTKIKFDVYHRGMAPLSGIPVKEILDSAVKVTRNVALLEETTGSSQLNLDVASPVITSLMKFNTWIERGEKATPKNKDAIDFIDIMGDQYGHDLDAFIRNSEPALSKYINGGAIKKPFVLSGEQPQSIHSVREFRMEVIKMYIKLDKVGKLKEVSPEDIVAAQSELDYEESVKSFQRTRR